LQIKDEHCDRKTDLFEHRRDHHGTIPDRIARQDQEQNLPRDRDTDEAVKELGMRDRRRRIYANPSLEKELRHKHDQPVNPRHQKHHSRKLHR